MTSPPRAAVVGSCGIGLTLRLDRVPDAGETLTGASFAQGAGGKGSNQAIGIRRLGLEVQLLTMVGADPNGRSLLELWEAEGVDAGAVLTGAGATMVGAILVEPSGENRIVVAPGVLDEFGPAALAGLDLDGAAACLVNLEIPVETAVAALALARRAGAITVLNPAPAAPLLAAAWSTVDHLTPNRSEAAALTGLPADAPPDELVSGLRRLCTGAICLTLGDEGALVDADGAREAVPAVPVERVVDTTGAGDAFSAAYTVALVEGATPFEAARFAVHAGAFAVTRAEVIPALPHRSDLAAAPVPVAAG